MGGGQEDQVDESIFCSNICNLIVYDSDNKENEDSDEETIVGNFLVGTLLRILMMMRMMW